MSKNTRWSAEDLKKKGLVQNEAGDYVPVSSLAAKGKVDKLPSLMEQCKPLVDTITETHMRIQNAISKLPKKGLDTKIEFKKPGAYDGSKHRAIELDKYGLMEKPKNPFKLPDGEIIDIKFTFDLEPFPAPRMSRSDQWRTDPCHPDPKKRQRKCVFRYFAWRDAFRAMSSQKGFVLGERLHVVFIFPLPESYSRKKRETLMGQLHKQKPDFDNCCKSLGDAFRVDDGYICDVRVIKLWGPFGRILIF